MPLLEKAQPSMTTRLAILNAIEMYRLYNTLSDEGNKNLSNVHNIYILYRYY